MASCCFQGVVSFMILVIHGIFKMQARLMECGHFCPMSQQSILFFQSLYCHPHLCCKPLPMLSIPLFIINSFLLSTISFLLLWDGRKRHNKGTEEEWKTSESFASRNLRAFILAKKKNDSWMLTDFIRIIREKRVITKAEEWHFLGKRVLCALTFLPFTYKLLVLQLISMRGSPGLMMEAWIVIRLSDRRGVPPTGSSTWSKHENSFLTEIFWVFSLHSSSTVRIWDYRRGRAWAEETSYFLCFLHKNQSPHTYNKHSRIHYQVS